ncbi:MAG: hypothetical protein GXO00_02190 [Candidatus Diapherotrites archaeon]|nr:hypothetical protein [Candidatus Diapherotrites archaeon]
MSVNWSINWSSLSVTRYSSILNYTNLSSYSAFFSPIKDVWMSSLHSWFFAFVIFITCGVTYIKMRSLFPTAIVMLLISSVMIAAAPREVGIAVYLTAVLALFAIFYSLLAERW